MTIELVNTIASVGTLLVIAATAVAALVQLRHTRGSNQIVALTECREVLESEAFTSAMRYVQRELPTRFADPEFRERLDVRPLDADLAQINMVGNFFETMGVFVKHGIVDADVGCDLWSGVVIANWKAMKPVIARWRRTDGPALLENFEYLATLSEDFNRQHPRGTYPDGLRRQTLTDDYSDGPGP